MKLLSNTTVFKKTILGLFVVIAVLAPVSVSFLQTDSSGSQEEVPLVTFELQTTYAQEKSSWGFGPSDIASWIFKYFGNAILSVTSSITWLGGKLLEWSLEYTVFNLRLDGGLGNAVNGLWSLIRDICNLAFIFGFIYVGIRTIIDPESADTKRFVSRIIIGALLINFSLFFTKIVIDFSNFTAVQIYNAMVSGSSSGTISSKIADVLGLTGFFGPSRPEIMNELSSGGMFWYFVMSGILLLVTAFVLAAASILLLIRFIALIFIMIFSPILFAATVFPQTASFASDLWHKLISYSFFAPAYLLMTLISIRVLSELGMNSNTTLVKAITDPQSTQSSFEVIAKFVIAICFFVGALIVAQKMGIKGGDMAISAGNSLRGKAQGFMGGATFGMGARLGRATAGRIAHQVSERDGLKDAASKRGIAGWAARQTLKGSRVVGDASFDARNIAGAGQALGIGEGRKGGYKTVMGEVEEKKTKFAKSLGEIDDTDTRVEGRKKEMEEAERILKRDRTGLQKTIRDSNNPGDKDTALKQLADLEKKHKETQEAYGKEKQRRVIGSSYADVSKETLEKKNEFETEAEKVKVAWNKYIHDVDNEVYKLNDDKKKAALESMQKMKDDLEKVQKDYKESLKKEGDRGYTSVLENSKWWNAWPVGRIIKHETEAGEAIRKAFEKKIKKSKEDSRHEELIGKLDKK